MKRPFRRFEVLYLAAALAGGAGCNPDHSVKPGAPVLTEVSIVEGGGATITSIPAGEPDCAAGTAGGLACDPMTASTCFAGAPIQNWCRCVATMAPPAPTPPPTCNDGGMGGAAGGGSGAAGAGGGAAGMSGADAGADAGAPGPGGGGASADAGADAAAPPAGTWNCDPFAPSAQVLFIFDRVLDTRPLDPGDAGMSVAAASVTAADAPVPSNADYRPNGSPGQIIFPAFGDFRADGPSLLVAGVPALPETATVTVKLDDQKVRAKDGHTPFTDSGNFKSGSLTFSTVAFGATLTAPAPVASTDPCAPPVTTVALDATGTITFNSPVDVDTLSKAVTVTSGGTAVDFTLMSGDGMNVTIAPKTTWPANATIVITIPDTVVDLNGEALGTGNGQTASFTTGAP